MRQAIPCAGKGARTTGTSQEDTAMHTNKTYWRHNVAVASIRLLNNSLPCCLKRKDERMTGNLLRAALAAALPAVAALGLGVHHATAAPGAHFMSVTSAIRDDGA